MSNNDSQQTHRKPTPLRSGSFTKAEDVFCNRKLISKEIYYETKHTIVLYNARPIVPGHSLIIPKRHVADFTDLGKTEALDMFGVIRRIKPLLLERYRCDSYTLTAQVGEGAGMTVNHFHMHIVPRRKDDRYGNDDNRIYDRLYGSIGRMSAKRKWIESEAKALRMQLKSR